MGTRFFCLAGTLFHLSASISLGATLTEGEAVSLALENAGLTDATEGVIGEARARWERARRWPNPVLSYQREETNGQDDVTENYAWLSQTVDIGGRRAKRGEAAAERVNAARLGGEALRRSRRIETQERFLDALLLERRSDALESWLGSGTRIAGIVSRREKAGEVSGYDRRRIQREQMSASAKVAAERASSERAKERLRALVGSETSAGPWTSVSGELLPAEKLPPVEELLEALQSRPDLQALEAEFRASDLDSRAAGRWWLPDVTVGAGAKMVDVDSENLTGPFLTFSVPLPVLDQDQADAQEASSRGRLARGRYKLLHDSALGEVRGLRAEATSLIRAAKTFRKDALRASNALVATAEHAYDAGEMDLLEVLDAHRSGLEAELQALELEASARRAVLELSRAAGVDL
jgi:cobalt-zinc-cadmium efflux system outer membrane protein